MIPGRRRPARNHRIRPKAAVTDHQAEWSACSGTRAMSGLRLRWLN
jgi:hypothetical protein